MNNNFQKKKEKKKNALAHRLQSLSKLNSSSVDSNLKFMRSQIENGTLKRNAIARKHITQAIPGFLINFQMPRNFIFKLFDIDVAVAVARARSSSPLFFICFHFYLCAQIKA